ncbi:MAG: rod shape-determining protein [Deltaproteobacteria bacterium]|nr:rod shape-determining protein [Deltaproteobacteria bacterium]MBW2309320.1 rod shape-determining protein [Deltaproteobacteria bacterium]
MLNTLLGWFSKDMAMDLGTANTLIYIKKEGIVLNEPSVVAIARETGEVIAVGKDAKEYIGRSPQNIHAIRPLKDGVISDFDSTREMIKFFFRKAAGRSRLLRPMMVIGVPSGITQVEKRAVLDSAHLVGARRVYLIEEPMAAAIGARLNIHQPSGNMVVDIGGGTTEVAVISMNTVVYSESVRVAGDEANEAIQRYILKKHHLQIGENAAEQIKIAIGSAYPLKQPMIVRVAGKDIMRGVPRTIEINDTEVREAMSEPVNAIVNSVLRAFEQTPPELAADIKGKGIVLAGGGALLKGVDKLIEQQTNVSVMLSDDPLTTVVEGCGTALEDLKYWKPVFIN